eukprot:gnl/TRDRNA2_/TRDRNA2_184315_c0_seq1.p1 gnl/TRDRNA2_/TRDRNA2_184315_c0~~gnl/TRDRNA2_/TRDRNA2_184315_c0_seq1.p1  ORF type:complete len:491 (-),score=80.87 gnl/TRDRNA2_/TRDRNA2_184315_c0_seq1:49-1521(-)
MTHRAPAGGIAFSSAYAPSDDVKDVTSRPQDLMLHLAAPCNFHRFKPAPECQRRAVSHMRLTLMTCFTFTSSIIWSIMGIIVLPAEAHRLFPQLESVYLSGLSALAAFSTLVSPIVGLLSDRHRSAWGRRRPFIAGGTALAAAGSFGMWQASLRGWPSIFAFCLLAAQLGLNAANAAQASLIPDLYSGHERGEASAIISVLSFGGNLTGMAMVWVGSAVGLSNVHVAYPMFMLLLVVTGAIVCVAASELSTDYGPPPPMTAAMLRRAYLIDPNDETDFFFIFAARAFYFVSTSVQMFMYYYLRDLVQVGASDELIHQRLASMAIVAMGVAVVTSYPLGRFSSIVGRKPLMYLASIGMLLVYSGYAAAPLLTQEASRVFALYTLALAWGVSMSLYSSVDYAMVLDCIPFGRGCAESLALWKIAGFFGSGIGPMVAGALLEICGASWQVSSSSAGTLQGNGYSFSGYLAVLSMGASSAICIAIIMTLVNASK